MEATTDREIMMQLDGNIKQLRESIERFAKTLENLEQTKISNMEDRLNKLENFVSKWNGAYKVLTILGVILGIIAVLKSFIH